MSPEIVSLLPHSEKGIVKTLIKKETFRVAVTVAKDVTEIAPPLIGIGGMAGSFYALTQDLSAYTSDTDTISRNIFSRPTTLPTVMDETHSAYINARNQEYLHGGEFLLSTLIFLGGAVRLLINRNDRSRSGKNDK